MPTKTADKLKRLLDTLKELEKRGELASFEELAEILGLDPDEVERLVDVLIVTGKVTPESVESSCSVSSSCSKCPLRAVCSKSTTASSSMKKFRLS